MQEYAKIDPTGTVMLKRQWFKDGTTFLPRAAAQDKNKPFWLPIEHRGSTPKYNSRTHFPPLATVTIEDDKVVEGWSVAIAKNNEEIVKDKERAAQKLVKNPQAQLTKHLLMRLFVLENRIRVLEGKEAISVRDYLMKLKELGQIDDTTFAAFIVETLDNA